MRKIIIFSLAVSLGMFTACSDGNAALKVNKSKLADAKKRDIDISKGAPVISLDKKEYDFGTVTDGAIIETSFTLTNTGKSPLIITDAKTTCGCTVPTWPKDKPIAPGESTVIEVKFDTGGKGGGRQVKDVTLFTNTAVGREVLKIKGIVNKKQ